MVVAAVALGAQEGVRETVARLFINGLRRSALRVVGIALESKSRSTSVNFSSAPEWLREAKLYSVCRCQLP
ncbi:MAG: hypothetical protein QOH27_53 [Mycobacterium sp.]|jgi:hypothetical protein|nr:hypothetical protein [Mycobacterium sp.]